jgi:C-terminal processing protease CtpA/Prc
MSISSETFVYKTIELIQDILENKLQDTDAIVIDLRSNSGGLVSFGTRLTQLFSPYSALPSYRVLPNNINRFIVDRFYPESEG